MLSVYLTVRIVAYREDRGFLAFPADAPLQV